MSKLCRNICITLRLHDNIIRHQIIRRFLTVCINKPTYKCVNSIKPFASYNVESVRQKTTKKKEYDSDDDVNEDNSDDASLKKDSRILKFKTTSMRTDLILKQGLGIARNKIEQFFYESKIRLNGKKLLKKSTAVGEGDEIDIIKSTSPHNPNHLYVSRIEVLNVKANEENISVTLRRFKKLLIENYEEHPYKGTNDNAQ